MTEEMEMEISQLRGLLREERIKVVELRTMLQELIDRRRKVAEDFRRQGLAGTDPALVDGHDGRYARAQKVVDENRALTVFPERQARTDDLVPDGGGT